MSQSRISPLVENTREPSVRGFLHLPESPSGDGLVLTHGAGADCQSLLLVALATAFCESGLTVLRCDLPFRQMHPHGPPPRGSAERDQEGLRHAVEVMRQRFRGMCFWEGIPTEDANRPCWPLRNRVWPMDSCCSHTRFTHPGNRSSYESITFQT